MIIPVLGNILLVLLFYLLEKGGSVKKLSFFLKQGIIGVLFGIMSVLASEVGFQLNGAVANVRDAAPLCAGLIFGGPAGIIAGLIGGAYRWFSVYWGAGVYTRLACTIATATAGFVAAAVRRFMFDNKKPNWIFGVAVAVVWEVVHMLLIFVTNMSDVSRAFHLVRDATAPMIVANAATVGISLLLVNLLYRERLMVAPSQERIAQTFQRWLLLCIVAAYLVTSLFTFVLQKEISEIETTDVITQALADIHQDILDASDENLLRLTELVKEEYEGAESPSLFEIAKKYNVSEINIVDERGIIVSSSVPAFLGYDMSVGEQASAFLVLLEGETSLVQAYLPTSFASAIYRKYAGMSLEEGGFIQVGYNSSRFHADIAEAVTTAARNRHIGRSGTVLIANGQMSLVNADGTSGRLLSGMGIDIDKRTMKEGVIYETMVEGVPHLFAYRMSEGYHIVGLIPTEEAMFLRDTSLYTSAFMQILIFATLFVFIYILIKRIIINNLKRINDSLGKITNGNLNVTVDVRSNEEFASLSDDINSTVATLKRYIAEAAARLDKELEYAKEIQMSALPARFHPDSEKDRFDVYAQMIAAKEVGGDFYDFYMLDEDKVAFLTADVSGKGIPAALFMMTAKTILKDLAESGLAVDEILNRANEKLCENNESSMFVTCWMGILDLRDGRLCYANAGHNPPLILRRSGEFEYLRGRAGFVLAGMSGMRYRQSELTLHPGERIFLYTDGVTEATDSSANLYGEDRLAGYLNAHKSDDNRTLLAGLKENIDAFVGEAPQFDDITMLLLDYKRGREDLRTTVFPAETAALDSFLATVEAELEKADCPLRSRTSICVALEEVFVNVAKYAYQDPGEIRLETGFDEKKREFCFRLRDTGIPFDPLGRSDPDITLSTEERGIGGLGIFIAKKTMDSIHYRYEDRENILTMYKKL